MMASWFGLTMGKRIPARRAWVRKRTVMCCRSGMPKEMLLTPRTVCRPISRLTYSTARRVSQAWACWAETVRVRQSMSRSSRGMPWRRQAASIRFAISTRPCQVSGMPSASMVRPTTAAPYRLHRGRIRSSTSGLPFTELTMARPLTARRPASMAAGSEESICKGRSHTLCTAFTTRVIISASLMPGSPTLMSKSWAPASCCSTARSRI